ncbi:inositol 2-dehydrogenase [Bombilactobacillus thymidiniphilus]|uniref:Inositol 2-dehydrogenase n=1 Tax=Bombilactobacillus thymidiniphilus TaxID=2923363 RepID=A0ABY4PEQ0_9LACO|nr:inositol 2-dehydrogenase [Bombilactobacillus thymidiniphilus]UQS84115.1 inositol 2-dehydrogenase [Bombilactobacillus thymidiniphilus]
MVKIRIGVIGLGRIGKMHLENLANLRECYEVKGIAAPRTPNIAELAEKYDVSFYTRDAQELIINDEIDAVLIASSTNTHAELIEAAAKAGKNIFCEKPVAEEINDIKHALQVVKDNQVKLQIGFDRRFDHNFRTIYDYVQSGKIGDPQIIRISSRDPEPPSIDYIKVSGGLFNDMMIHDFDMARYLSQSEVTEVYAIGDSLIDPEIGKVGDIDTAIVTLKFENGAIGEIDNSRKAVYGHDQRAEVFGSKGKVETDNDRNSNIDFETDDGGHHDKIPKPFQVRYAQAYIDELKEFYNSIEKDESVRVSGTDALRAAQLAQAAQKSLAAGKPVKVEY